jgi:hypothetical protein
MSLHAIAMRHVRLCCILLPLLGAGCADLRPDGEPARPGAPGQAGYEDVSKAAATLLEGIRLYENGNFKEAIAAFGAPDVQAAPAAIRVNALKYSAFSYCVLENYAQCRHAFDLALGLDPDFALRSSERGHPMWGTCSMRQKRPANRVGHISRSTASASAGAVSTCGAPGNPLPAVPAHCLLRC